MNKLVFAAFWIGRRLIALPDAAISGETFAAFFAGERAASKTVSKPITIPAITLGILKLNIGIEPKYSGLSSRSMAHKPHMTTIPVITPIGIAK